MEAALPLYPSKKIPDYPDAAAIKATALGHYNKAQTGPCARAATMAAAASWRQAYHSICNTCLWVVLDLSKIPHEL